MYCCINSGGVTVFLTEIQKCSLSSFHQKITLLCNLKQLTRNNYLWLFHSPPPTSSSSLSSLRSSSLAFFDALSLRNNKLLCMLGLFIDIFSNTFSDLQIKKTLFTFHLYIKLPNAKISRSLSFFSLSFTLSFSLSLSLILTVFVSQTVWKLQLQLI